MRWRTEKIHHRTKETCSAFLRFLSINHSHSDVIFRWVWILGKHLLYTTWIVDHQNQLRIPCFFIYTREFNYTALLSGHSTWDLLLRLLLDPAKIFGYEKPDSGFNNFKLLANAYRLIYTLQNLFCWPTFWLLSDSFF